jgi:hyperosmotically inducible protein
MRNRRLFLLPLLLTLVAIPGFGKEHITDAEVVAEVQDHLFHAHVFQHGQVQVTFQGGVATLTGAVDSYGVKLDAEHAARKQEDVTQVVNQIRVDTDDVRPLQIVTQARKEIVTYPFYTIFDWIVLEVQGNDLIVSGQVTDPFKKTDIGNFLAHVRGVADLKNNLQVLPVSDYDSGLRIAIARAIYGDPYFVNYADQALPSIHIIVDNGNVTLEGVVNSEVDRAKAQEDARFAATFFSLTNKLRVETKQ